MHGPISATQNVLIRGLDFSGRATRAEYWWFACAQFVMMLFAGLLDLSLALQFASAVPLFLGAKTFLLLFLTIPNVALAVRRLHDTGHSGFYLFLLLVPFVGSVLLLGMMVLPSETATNKYGDPFVSPIRPTGELDGISPMLQVPLVRRS